MAEPPRYPEASDEPGVPHDLESMGGTPRWVKVFALIALVAVVLFVVVTLVGGGEHGPGRHSGGGSDTPGVHTGPPPGFEHADQQP